MLDAWKKVIRTHETLGRAALIENDPSERSASWPMCSGVLEFC